MGRTVSDDKRHAHSSFGRLDFDQITVHGRTTIIDRQDGAGGETREVSETLAKCWEGLIRWDQLMDRGGTETGGLACGQ